MEITVFKNLYSQTPHVVTLGTILDRFKNQDSNNIAEMATLKEDDYQRRKKMLPVACFGGVFSKRSNSALQRSSGLMVLDFDKVDKNAVKGRLRSNESVYAYFDSPSGDGVKALVLIEQVKSDFEYKQYYEAFAPKFEELDQSGKDISRACFFCYDPDLYVNPKAVVFKTKVKKSAKQPKKPNVDYVKNDYSVANKACEIIRHAPPGEGHVKIRNAARLLGGFVAANKISYDEAERILLQEAYARRGDDPRDNERVIRDGLENGMNEPINVEKLHKELEQEQSVIKYGKIYYTLADKRESLLELFENGNQRGYTTGHERLDDIYSVKLGTTTYVYGAPYHGKTQFWFEVLLCLSQKHGLKHAIFSPETGTATDIFAELCSMYAQQDFTNTFNNRMPEDNREAAFNFVDKHFIVIDPSYKVITHNDFFNYISEIERVYNTKIHTTTIDPFNEFRQDLSKFSNRQDLYLEAVLAEVRENARLNNRHNCIITHVQDQQMIQDKDTGKRYYPQPSYREIAGGQAWSRRGMSMLSVWRPPKGLTDEHGYVYADNVTIVQVQKSKPKGIGRLGQVELDYDVKKHRYTSLGNHPDLTPKENLEPKVYYQGEISEDDECPF